MSGARAKALLLVGVSLARIDATAAAGAAAPTAELAPTVAWRAQAVRFPVSDAEALAAARASDAARDSTHGDDGGDDGRAGAADSPWLPAAWAIGDETTAPVTVGPGKAAAFALLPLSLVRISRADATVPVRLRRVQSDGRAVAFLHEPGLPLGEGCTLVVEPPGAGGAWLVDAAKDVTITISRPVRIAPRSRWAEAEAALGRFLARDEAPGPRDGAASTSEGAEALLPVVPGASSVAWLVAAARAVGGDEARPWRRAFVRLSLATVWPTLAPWFERTALDLPFAGATGPEGVDDTAAEDRADADDATADDATADDDDATAADAADVDARPDREPKRWWRVTGPASVEITPTGGGVIEVQARRVRRGLVAAIPAEPADAAPASLELGDSAGRLARAEAPASAGATVRGAGAFPEARSVTSARGEPLGPILAARAALAAGHGPVTINLGAGTYLVRATWARPRRRLLTWIGDDDAPRALTLPAPGPPPGSSVTARAFVAAATVERGAAPALSTMLALLGELPPTTAPALAWRLRVAALAAYGADPDIRAAALDGVPLPDGAALLSLAPLLGPHGPRDHLRSRSIAAFDLAFRSAPLDPDARRRYLTAFRRDSVWRSVSAAPQGDQPAPASVRFVDTAGGASGTGDPSRAGTDLFALPPARPLTVDVPASAFDPERPVLLRLVVRGAAKARSVLIVDGASIAILPGPPTTLVELATVPGRHTLQVGGSAAAAPAMALVAATPVGPAPAEPTLAAEPNARLRSMVPAGDAASPTWFRLPAANLPGPVQITVRAAARSRPAASLGAPIPLLVHTDLGPFRSIDLVCDAPDPGFEPIGDGEAMCGAARFSVWLPPGARAISVVGPGDRPLLVTVAVRAPRPPPSRAETAPALATDGVHTASGAPPGAAPPTPYTAIAALSADLARAPDDVPRRAERALHLIDLGQYDLARQDLLRLAAADDGRWPPAVVARVDYAFGRYAAATAPTDLPRPSFASLDRAAAAPALAPNPAAPPPPPVILAPAIAALPETLWTKAHALAGADAATRFAGWQALHAETGAYAAGLAALDAAAELLATDPAPPGVAPLAFALAHTLLAEAQHSRVRRILLLAGALSRYRAIDGGSGGAGYERLVVDDSEARRGPGAEVRAALVAAPWPAAEAVVLRPGGGTSLELSLTDPVGAEVWLLCRPLRAASAAEARLSIRLDRNPPLDIVAAPGGVTTVPLGPLGAGRHVAEVTLASESAGYACAVRFVTDRPVGPDQDDRGVDLRHATKLTTVTQARPLSLRVLAPGALWIEGRTAAPGRPSRLDVVATPRGGGPAIRRLVTLPLAADAGARTEARRRLAVGRPAELLLPLAAVGEYDVTIASDGDPALVRLALREDAAGERPTPPGPWYLALGDDEPLAAGPIWPAWPPPLAPLAVAELGADAPSPGTFAVETRAGTRLDQDQDLPEVRASAELWLTFHRRERRSLVYYVGAGVRDYDGAFVGGARAGAYVIPTPGLRLSFTVSALAQPGADAWGLRARLRLSAPIERGPLIRLTPQLALFGAVGERGPNAATVDPQVHSRYAADHPLQLQARLTVRAAPFSDAKAEALTWVTSNSGPSVDHVGVGVVARWLGPAALGRALAVALSYRPSLRLADDHRTQTAFEQRTGAEVSWLATTSAAGRWLVVAGGEAVWSTTAAARITAWLGLRLELAGGRGTTDAFPPDEDFAPAFAPERPPSAQPGPSR
jgi:hypothetical protein